MLFVCFLPTIFTCKQPLYVYDLQHYLTTLSNFIQSPGRVKLLPLCRTPKFQCNTEKQTITLMWWPISCRRLTLSYCLSEVNVMFALHVLEDPGFWSHCYGSFVYAIGQLTWSGASVDSWIQCLLYSVKQLCDTTGMIIPVSSTTFLLACERLLVW